MELTSIDKAFVTKVSIVAALGGLLFGFDTAIISGAIPYIAIYFNLHGSWLGWAVSSILIGCAFGALVAGKLADLLGRRFVLMICAVLFAVSGLGAGLCNSLTGFISYRLIGGLGVGAAAMVSPMYIAETVPAALRGRLVSLYQLAIVLGILLAYLSNYLFDGTGVNNWRWMFASQIAPAILFFTMLWFVPESPRWLVKVHRLQDAKSILSRTGYAAQEVSVIAEMQKSFSHSESNSFSELFSRKYRPFVFLGVSVAVFQQITGINSVFYYAPVIFKQTGLDATSSLLQTIIMGVVNVLATFIAIGLVDRLGRKFFLTLGSLLMGALPGSHCALFSFQLLPVLPGADFHPNLCRRIWLYTWSGHLGLSFRDISESGQGYGTFPCYAFVVAGRFCRNLYFSCNDRKTRYFMDNDELCRMLPDRFLVYALQTSRNKRQVSGTN